MKTILCAKCKFWFHQSCCNLSDEQFKFLGKVEKLNFICEQCCLNPEGKFDFHAALCRLRDASDVGDMNLLKDAAKFEEIFLRGQEEALVTCEKVRDTLFL